LDINRALKTVAEKERRSSVSEKSDSIAAIPIPVSSNRRVASLTKSENEVGGRKTIGDVDAVDAVGQEPVTVLRIEHTGRICPRAGPITRDRLIAALSETDQLISRTGAVRIAQLELIGRWSENSDCVVEGCLELSDERV